MHRIRTFLGGVILMGAVSGLALGLEGANGYTATTLAVSGDVRDGIVYDATFSGELWADMPTFAFDSGNASGQQMAHDGSGTLYYVIRGSDLDSLNWTGLVAFDGTSHRNLIQLEWNNLLSEGERIQTVVMSPVTAGRLTAGHPVYLRHSSLVPGAEIVSVNPDSSPPAETLVHTLPLTEDNDIVTRCVIDGGGTIYLLGTDDSIRRLDWNGTAYDESEVATGYGSGLTVAPDGTLYSFSATQSWASATQDPKDIYRIDPDTGAASVFASVSAMTFVWDWAWDSSGTLWIAVRETKRKGKRTTIQRYVTEVLPGATTSSTGAASSSGYDPRGLATAPEGRLMVLEWGPTTAGDSPADAIHELTPSADGGDGGSGGGGKGGGKGKNK